MKRAGKDNRLLYTLATLAIEHDIGFQYNNQTVRLWVALSEEFKRIFSVGVPSNWFPLLHRSQSGFEISNESVFPIVLVIMDTDFNRPVQVAKAQLLQR